MPRPRGVWQKPGDLRARPGSRRLGAPLCGRARRSRGSRGSVIGAAGGCHKPHGRVRGPGCGDTRPRLAEVAIDAVQCLENSHGLTAGSRPTPPQRLAPEAMAHRRIRQAMHRQMRSLSCEQARLGMRTHPDRAGPTRSEDRRCHAVLSVPRPAPGRLLVKAAVERRQTCPSMDARPPRRGPPCWS